MRTKRYLSLLLLFSWLWLASEVAAAPVLKIASEQAPPEMHNLQQQLLSPDTDAQPKDRSQIDQLQPYREAPHIRVKPKQHCESLEVIAASCEPAPGSPLSAFPVVLNTIHLDKTVSS